MSVGLHVKIKVLPGQGGVKAQREVRFNLSENVTVSIPFSFLSYKVYGV